MMVFGMLVSVSLHMSLCLFTLLNALLMSKATVTFLKMSTSQEKAQCMSWFVETKTVSLEVYLDLGV